MSELPPRKHEKVDLSVNLDLLTSDEIIVAEYLSQALSKPSAQLLSEYSSISISTVLSAINKLQLKAEIIDGQECYELPEDLKLTIISKFKTNQTQINSTIADKLWSDLFD